MNEPLWLSRIRLRDAPDVRRLYARLTPGDAADAHMGEHHHLIWDVFGGPQATDRDFLWREDGQGRFLALSRRTPPPETALFEIESRPFEPRLTAGDRLRFTLRANATMSVGGMKSADRRGKPVDVAMHALKDIAKGERAPVRHALAAEAGAAWLHRQGLRSGFVLPEGDEAVTTLYQVRRTSRPRAKGGGVMTLGVFDFDGVLRVTDPAAFVVALARGFGRAKAFGLGLMLIARST